MLGAGEHPADDGRPCGVSATHGSDARTSKKMAPVRRTARSTSDNASIRNPSRTIEPQNGGRVGVRTRNPDDRQDQPDGRSFERPYGFGTLANIDSTRREIMADTIGIVADRSGTASNRRARGHQEQAADHLVVWRLRDHRHDAADRRRIAVRGGGPARGVAGARRRGRQRQLLAGRRAPVVRRHVHRLRSVTARGRTAPRRRPNACR